MDKLRSPVHASLTILLAASVASGCGASDDSIGTKSQGMYSGVPLTPSEAQQKGIVRLSALQGTSSVPKGSASILTPNWVLTAAHVVLDSNGDVSPAFFIGVGAPYETPNIPKAIVPSSEVFVHPLYPQHVRPGSHIYDMALIHIPGSGLPLVGGFLRPVSSLSLEQMLVPPLVARCTGFGAHGGPSDNLARWADFNLHGQPGSGFLFHYRGGGDFPDQFTPPTEFGNGDSGGPCVDRSDPDADQATQVSIIHAINDAGPAATIGYSVPAENFRSFAAALMFRELPPFKYDLDFDGTLDTLGIQEDAGGATFRIALQLSASGTTFYFPPVIAPGIPSGFSTALINAGDFNGDSRPDVFAMLGAVPFHLAQISAGVFQQQVFSLPKAYSFFDTGDFDHDGFDDVRLVADDGSSDVVFGSTAGLGAPGGGVPRGMDWDGDGREDLGITVANPLTGFPGRVAILDPDSTEERTNPVPGYGASVAFGNLDGQLGDELLVAAPGELVELTSPTKRVAFGAPVGSNMGASVSAGDVNGDGLDDVIMGATSAFTFENVNYPDGGVLVVHGSPAILDTSGGWVPTNRINATAFPIVGSAHTVCLPQGGGCITLSTAGFGYSTTTGDFDCDGYEDLAVGAPLATVGAVELAGAVGVIYGSAAGLNSSRTQVWNQVSPGLNGTASGMSCFGMSLAAGNFNGDTYRGRGCIDLAISAPDELNHGGVYVIYGGPDGLAAVRPILPEATGPSPASDHLLPGTGGVAAIASPGVFGGNFGASLAMSRADADQYDDLIVGAPGDDESRGAVYVLRGGPVGIIAAGHAKWTRAASLPDGGIVGEGDWFGGKVGSFANGGVLSTALFADEPPLGASAPLVSNVGELSFWEVADSGGFATPPTVPAALQSDSILLNGWALAQDQMFGWAVTSARPAFISARQRFPRFDLTPWLTSDGLEFKAEPRCSSANAEPDLLWPPNSKFIPVSIVGVARYPNQPVLIEITSVTQDEPSSPGGDATILPDGRVALRARRSPHGGGRVYHIAFTATASHGEACSGEVTVCVPLHPGQSCTDEGSLHASVKEGRHDKHGHKHCGSNDHHHQRHTTKH